jgi:hypothetical protein
MGYLIVRDIRSIEVMVEYYSIVALATDYGLFHQIGSAALIIPYPHKAE